MKSLKIVLIIIFLATLSLIAQQMSKDAFLDPGNTDFISHEDTKSGMLESGNDFAFIENLGQIRDEDGNSLPQVLFFTRSQSVDMYVTSTGLSYVFRANLDDCDGEDKGINYCRLDMELLGCKKNITIKKELPVDQQINYYTAEYPKGIAPKAYKKISIENVYKGVDLVYYEKEGRMKYDFIVKAGADPGKIKMKYNGAEEIIIDADGNVVIKTRMGEIKEAKPSTFTRKAKREIKSNYKIKNNIVQFNVSGYNKNEDIIIDPVSIWSTYYGGTAFDEGRSICTDNSGNVYVVGSTGSTNFPTNELPGAYYQPNRAGGSDLFILKFNSIGERLWATYYGGSAGEEGYSACTDNSGALFVAGETKSPDFPVQALPGAYNDTTFAGVQNDIFILKFSSSGSRLWATYYGGISADYLRCICVDNSGNLYATGYTISKNFPTQELVGAYNKDTFISGSDSYILKFDSNCARIWATLFGGSSYEVGYSICTDNSGNLYATGHTGSTDFPAQSLAGAYNQLAQAGAPDAYVSKFNSSGVIIWSTYYGGSDQDYLYSICVDNSKNIYVSGSTKSTDYPTQIAPGGYNDSTFAGDWDISLMKFDANCARLWATYYGGSDSEDGNSCCTDIAGYLYVTGNTFSSDFPTQNYPGAYNQASLAATWDYDAYLLMFNDSCESIWATYYGGTDPDDGYGICRDDFANLYVTGRTESEDFPLLNLPGAYNQSTHVGVSYDDAFILRFGSIAVPIDEISKISSQYSLYQNYPNPFNSVTTIEFYIPETMSVSLSVYNLFGQKVSALLNKELQAGNHKVEFEADGLSSGTYYYTLEAAAFSETKRMMLTK